MASVALGLTVTAEPVTLPAAPERDRVLEATVVAPVRLLAPVSVTAPLATVRPLVPVRALVPLRVRVAPPPPRR